MIYNVRNYEEFIDIRQLLLFRSVCAFEQSDEGFRYPLTESIYMVEYMDKQGEPQSDCANFVLKCYPKIKS